MNSINPYFTFNYAQPEEYHFSHDSVFLARKVFELLPKNLEGSAGLDLCSGCGIVGLVFLYHYKSAALPMPAVFDFLEVQNIYRTYFEENVRSFGADLPTVNFLNQNYDTLKSKEFQHKYDFILSNPPYFRMNQGILSPSEFKNRCRFFIDSDFKSLIEGINNCLKPQGSAFILLRDLKKHGVDTLSEAQMILAGERSVSVIADIRGTPLVLIK
jgi:tRNA1Val (adenine37-N6)-methyltransferase